LDLCAPVRVNLYSVEPKSDSLTSDFKPLTSSVAGRGASGWKFARRARLARGVELAELSPSELFGLPSHGENGREGESLKENIVAMRKFVLLSIAMLFVVSLKLTAELFLGP
jgi:hypothetical protein